MINNNILEEDIAFLLQEYKEFFKKLRNKTILITGGSGFIGSFIVNLIFKLNEEFGLNISLILIVRSIEKAKRKFIFNNFKFIKFIEQDIIYPINLIENIDYCLHLASNANPVLYVQNPVETITTNILGTNNILNIFCNKPSIQKIICASTIEVYGEHKQDGLIKEDMYGAINLKNIRNSYPLSKACTENLSLSYAEQYSLPINIVRLGYIYGAGDNIEDPKVITSFIKSIKSKNNIILKSSGLQKRSYCYIRDAVYGIFLALLNKDTGEIYNISSTNNIITIKEIAENIVNLFGNNNQKTIFDEPTLIEKKQHSLIQNNLLDNSKITELGYKESVCIKEGLKRTGNYFGLKYS